MRSSRSVWGKGKAAKTANFCTHGIGGLGGRKTTTRMGLVHPSWLSGLLDRRSGFRCAGCWIPAGCLVTEWYGETMKILIVDDQADARESLAVFFRDAGHTVQCV